ncbi:DNA topoisomerase 1 isoform X2, partial [Tanacetum coccineum]
MKLAQKLYEGIKLPDGLHMSNGAVEEIRSFVTERYGKNYIPNNAWKIFKLVKNAQEVHEAIRPTDIRTLPSMLAGSLKLYTLIWSRSIACQMEPSVTEQIQVDIGNGNGSIAFRATNSRKAFPGYQAVYKDTDLGKVESKQHFTQHPSCYSEGSLVKKMEEFGIGRPSTYATKNYCIIKGRNYVTVKSPVLYPEFRGRYRLGLFLFHHFSEVTDYSFTADMETGLDNVSGGLTEWKGLLKDYMTRFSKYCERAGNVHIHQVEKMLENTFGDFLFASLPDQSRTCPSCQEGALIFKVSRFGAGYFIGCDQHPQCKYIGKTLYGDEDDAQAQKMAEAVEEPKILLKDGPMLTMFNLVKTKKGHLPKRAYVSQISDISSITLSLEDAHHF